MVWGQSPRGNAGCLAGFLAVSLVTVLGCGKGGTSDLVPVAGEVYVEQKPAEGALVVFHPVGGTTPEEWPHGLPHALVAEDGSFRLTLQPLGDGAPEGDYKVVVTWPALKPDGDPEAEEPETYDRLGGRWADPKTTTLTATVQGPNTELARFELK